MPLRKAFIELSQLVKEACLGSETKPPDVTDGPTIGHRCLFRLSLYTYPSTVHFASALRAFYFDRATHFSSPLTVTRITNRSCSVDLIVRPCGLVGSCRANFVQRRIHRLLMGGKGYIFSNSTVDRGKERMPLALEAVERTIIVISRIAFTG